MIENGQTNQNNESTTQREETINRWSKAGLLEGLTPDYKETIAKLFESQSSFIINEPNNENKNDNIDEINLTLTII